MKTKKNWAVLPSLLLILSLILIGCSSESKEATAPASNQSEQEQQAADTGGTEEQQQPEDQESLESLFNKGKNINEMYYEISYQDEEFNYTSEAWFKGKKMKIAGDMGGQETVSIFDMENGEIISYIPSQNMATKMKMEEYQGADDTTPVDFIEEIEDLDYLVSDTETVNGLKCDVVTYEDEFGTAKAWVSVDYGIVVKWEQVEPNGKKSMMEFKNLKIGSGSVPDDAFSLPSGVKVMDVNEMMKNMPEMPEMPDMPEVPTGQ